tara:strand:+ start:500 stop:1027 length:528 start_codon:yes stop_codon:yes gene_type:complete
MSKLQVETISHTNNTTGMTIDSSGRIATPARPSFLVRGYQSRTSGSQSINNITTNSSVGLFHSFDEVSHNIGSHFTNSSGKFVVPVTGLYLISVGYGYKVSTNYSNIVIFAQDGDNTLHGFQSSWTPNDESAYGDKIVLVKQCTVGDEIACGSNLSYEIPRTEAHYFNFGVTFLG